MTGSIALVVVSPRVPAGLMTREAWRCVEQARVLLGRSASEPLVEAVQDAGLDVELVDDAAPADLAARFVREAERGEGAVVWLGSADADPGLTDALAAELTQAESPPEVEVVVGSWDAPGSRLLDAVAVMDALRSPGGCPWDAAQTHASLAPYLVEEAFETTEAIAEADNAHLEEELGDVLLQVLFHARVAAERGEDGFDIDGVAGTLVEKLLRRHPHVFGGDVTATDDDDTAAGGGEGKTLTAQDVEDQWALIKAEEKPERDPDDVLGAVPSGMPPLERATKYVARLLEAGRGDLLEAAVAEDALGPALLDLVVQAHGLGRDPALALSGTLQSLERAARPR